MKRSARDMIGLRSVAASGSMDEVQFLLEFTTCKEEEKIFAYIEALENHHGAIADILKAQIPEFDKKLRVITIYAQLTEKSVAYNHLRPRLEEPSLDEASLYWDAIEYGYIEMVQFFLESPTLWHKERHDDIAWAIRFERLDILHYLMARRKEKPYLYAHCEQGNGHQIPYLTALIELSGIEGLAGFKFLLSMIPGDKKMYTKTLIAGISYGLSVEAVKYLVTLGADPLAYDNQAIIHAAWMNRSINMMKYLLSLGADINAQDGKAIVNAALVNGRESEGFIEFMLENGAKPSNEALINAVKSNYLASVMSLLKHGADHSYENYRPLRNAVCDAENECVKFLLQPQYYDFTKDPASIIGAMEGELLREERSVESDDESEEEVSYSTWSYVYSILQKQNIKLTFELPEKFQQYMALEAPHLVNINPMIHFHSHCKFYVEDFPAFQSSYLEMYYCAIECPTEVLHLILFQLFDLRTGLKDSHKALDLRYLTVEEEYSVLQTYKGNKEDRIWLAMIRANSEETRKQTAVNL